MPVRDRLELLELQRQRRDARRHSRHQWFNSLGIAFGVLFTAASLVSTWLTLQATKEGQITDRYTKAIEQLGSAKPEAIAREPHPAASGSTPTAPSLHQLTHAPSAPSGSASAQDSRDYSEGQASVTAPAQSCPRRTATSDITNTVNDMINPAMQ
ncbi:hypothetical protein GCM10009678_94390 [Actinomadura kijaniata]|uniref:Uncharacterized protein n=1 Tax=Actinomadura namibiensis TaxID=182080 RepID=A0A7W3LWT2_ACTNM|nr:hypothetical protein [Actinomadura namibiensis]MBA8955650.1 hypothetical protein [Actinomadura namibiensis]